MSNSRSSTASIVSTLSDLDTPTFSTSSTLEMPLWWLARKKIETDSDTSELCFTESRSATPREEYSFINNDLHRSRSDSDLLKDWEGNIIHPSFG